MDYTYRSDVVPWNRHKCLYKVQAAESIGIHSLHQGGVLVPLKGASPGLYVKHFKTPQRGVFWGNALFQDSSPPDRYREQVLQAMATAPQ
jgi:hypothetical protein